MSASLTQDQSRQVEMVQEKAFVIILGRSYESYETGLESLQQERLDDRRSSLCHTQHSPMFPPQPRLQRTHEVQKEV